MMKLVWIVAVLATGCGARSELYVDIADAAIDVRPIRDAAPDVEVVDTGVDVPKSAFCIANDAGVPTNPANVCTASLIVGAIAKQSGGCYVDVAVHEGDTGIIHYACNGDPSTWAAVTVGATTFEGAVNGTILDVCIGTTYPWQDGAFCNYAKSTWASAQRIYGDITSGKLTFIYDEQQVGGSSCDIACWAQAEVVTSP